MKVIINGRIVTPEGIQDGSLAFDSGIIRAVGSYVPAEGDEIIDAGGCYVMPGFIDGHTHLQTEIAGGSTADDFESGTRAAACGGTTTLIDFATQDKGGTLIDALNTWKSRAQGVSRCNYGFHMAICDWNESVKQEMRVMAEEGVTSYKVYMAYDDLKVSDAEIYEILKEARENGSICGSHCENWDVIKKLQKELIESGVTGPEGHPACRPPVTEAEAVNRFAYLAELADAPIYIVHLSTRLGLEELRAARKRGVKVLAETCPHYLLLDDSCYSAEGFEGAKFVMSPPLRKQEDIDALREAVINGEIETIATDHCSFNYADQKTKGIGDFRKIPNGAPGLEHRPALIFDTFRGEMSVEKICDRLSGGPARLFGMYPRKGALQEGSDADIVIWDPDAEWTISAADQQQNVDYTIYEGMKVRGKAARVYVNGVLTAEYGLPNENVPGEYVARGAAPAEL